MTEKCLLLNECSYWHSWSYLKGLVETLHHTDPLGSLFGELACLNLESLHLMVEFTLVYICLGNSKTQEDKDNNVE